MLVGAESTDAKPSSVEWLNSNRVLHLLTTDHGDRGGKVTSTQNVQAPPCRHHLEEIDAARGRQSAPPMTTDQGDRGGKV